MGFANKIKALGWKRFIKSPEVFVEFIAQKFYANVPNVVNNKVMVKGVQVLFRPFDINAYYG